MSFKKSILLLSALGLFASMGPAKPRLSLGEAITATLENNFAYRIALLEPEIAREGVTRESARFDSVLFASGNVSQSEQDTVFSELTGTRTDNRQWEAGVRKRLVYGTSLSAQTSLQRLDSTAGIYTGRLSQDAGFSLNVRQPLLNNFGREVNLAAVESARAGFSISAESYRDTLLRLLAQTELAYWAVARWQEQLELNRSNLEVAEALLAEAYERERVGLATQIEVLQAEASRAQRMEEIINTTRSLGDAFDQLMASMGVLPDIEGALTEPAYSVDALGSSDRLPDEFVELWNLAQARDPGLAVQEAVIAQREWNRLVARNDLKPNLDLVLSGGYSGIDDETAEEAYDNALDRQGERWAVGFEFSMPWNRRLAKAEFRIRDKELEQERMRYRELKQSLFRDVRATWRDLEAVRQSIEAARLTVSLQEATFEREKSKYEEGLLQFRDVLEAQNQLDQARIRLLQAKQDRVAAEIEMARLTGSLPARHGLSPDVPALPGGETP